MKLNIREIAKKETVVAEIMNGREKGETEDLIKRNKPITINDFEACEITNDEGEKEIVYAYTVEEEPKMFYFAGYVLKKIFEKIIAACDGDYETAYSAVRAETLKVKLGEKKTKSKNTVTTVEVVD